MRATWFLLLVTLIGVALTPASFAAGQSRIYSAQTGAGLDETYRAVSAALEEARFWVVFEANLGHQMSRFAEKWAEEYNRNQLEGIRTLVVCNAWWANQVANADPEMLAFCPLRVALTHKEGVTRVLFVRPTLMAMDSPALPVMQEIEKLLQGAVDGAIGTLKP